MTGAGFAAGNTELGELRVEIRTVNGRGFSAKLRVPPSCSGYEVAIEEIVRGVVRRGSVVVVVERSASAPALPDADLLRAVADGLRRHSKELQLPPPALADVLHVATTVARGDALTSRPLPPQLRELFEQALADLVAHRRSDGRGTVTALLAELDTLAAHAAEVAARAPQLAVDFRARLLQRVRDFVAEHLPQAPPAFDVVREVAAFSDRADVAEELQRLTAHIAEVRAVLSRGGEVGKRLEFLLQELLRETNTLGAKSPDTTIAHAVVAMKTCVDRMKEQAANLE